MQFSEPFAVKKVDKIYGGSTMNTTTMNDTIILDRNTTNNLFEGSQLPGFETPVEGSLHDTMTISGDDTEVGGKNIQYATYDADGKRTRKSFLEGVGEDLKDINSLEAALNLSGLNFNVEKRFSYYNKNENVKGQPPRFVKDESSFKLVRTDTGEVLYSHVGPNYTVYQNIESFDFLDSLYDEGAKFETACLFGAGKKDGVVIPAAKVMICMSLPSTTILGDNYNQYLMFLNSFNQTLPLSVQFVPMRVYCSNMVNRALKNATSRIAIRHTKKMNDRLMLAHNTITSNTKYMEALKASSEKLALMPFSEDKFYELVKKEFPINEENSDTINNRNLARIALAMECYREDDLANFRGTAWGAVQAISDYVSHAPRFTKVRQPELIGINDIATNKSGEWLNKIWDMFEV